MKLSELSERSGVPPATIKYYLRERLLPPGRRVSATQAEYDESHLRRLVRALIQIGQVPVSAARAVLAAAEDDSLDQHERLGAAVWALPYPAEPEEEDTAAEAARREVDLLLERQGWHFGLKMGAHSPVYRTLVSAVASMNRLGYPADHEQLTPYANAAAQLAVHDLDLIEMYGTPLERVEAAVVLTMLGERVLLSLRRLAEAEESNHRFGKPVD
jgi:DNA-binding transcriptional MerR regulator